MSEKTNEGAPPTTALMVRSFEEALDFGRSFADCQLIPGELKRSPENIALTVLTGQELGIPPMAAMRTIHIVEGRPTLSADGMAGIVRKSGAAEYIRLVHSDATRAKFETKRRDMDEPTSLEFTIEEAQAAGLVKPKSNWEKYPAAMLRKRAKSMLLREVYEDVLAGVYDDDEAHEIAASAPPTYSPPPANGEQVQDAEIVSEEPAPAPCGGRPMGSAAKSAPEPAAAAPEPASNESPKSEAAPTAEAEPAAEEPVVTAPAEESRTPTPAEVLEETPTRMPPLERILVAIREAEESEQLATLKKNVPPLMSSLASELTEADKKEATKAYTEAHSRLAAAKKGAA